MSARTTRRAQSQAPLTHQESLLLAQAVWEVGASPTSWPSVSKLLSKHPLLSRPKTFFSPQACHSMYEQLMKDAELEIAETGHAAHAPVNRKLAEKHYQLRHSELRDLILVEESKFKTVLKEIEVIREGLLGHQSSGNVAEEPVTKDSTEAAQGSSNVAASKVAKDSDLSGVADLQDTSIYPHHIKDNVTAMESDIETPRRDALHKDKADADHSSQASGAGNVGAHGIAGESELVISSDDEDEEVADDDEGGGNNLPEDTDTEEDLTRGSEHANQRREEEEEEEAVMKQAEEEESKEEEEEEGSQGNQEEDVKMEQELDDEKGSSARPINVEVDSQPAQTPPPPDHETNENSSGEEAPVVTARRSSRRRKSSAASVQAPPSRKKLRSQGRMSVDHEDDKDSEEEEDEEEEDAVRKASETPQLEDERNSSPFEESVIRRGKRKASYQESLDSPSDKKRLREESEPVDEDESGLSSHNTRGGRLTRHTTRTEDKVALKRFQTVIGMLHSQISQHRNGNIFHNPIKHSEAPDYYEIVKRPMDLKTIKTRVKDGIIANSLEFQRDTFLMFANAMVYNRPGSDVHAMAEDMMLESEGQINAFRQTEGLVKRGQRP